MKTTIKRSPRELYESLCELVHNESWLDAKKIAEELANMGAQGVWLDLAFDLADGLKKLKKFSDKLFIMGEEVLSDQEIMIIKEAQTWVSNKLETPLATLIISIGPEGTPLHAITGINGFGFIAMSKSVFENESLLVHEITHCTLMSRAIFLDEGLATLMQYEVSGEVIPEALFYWDRPSIAALIEIDWSDDPYFSKIMPEQTTSSNPLENDLRVHHLAAYIINTVIKENSLNYTINALSKLKPSLREGRTAIVFEESFSINLWEIDEQISKNSPIEISKPSEISLSEIASQILAEENKELAIMWLPYARSQAHKNTDSLSAMIKILIMLGNNRENPKEGAPYRIEALVAINWHEKRNGDERIKDFFESYKYVFKLRNAGHSIELRSIGVLASNSFQELLIKYPNDPETIIATAKAQIKTDHELIPMESWKSKLEVVGSTPMYFKAVELLLEHTYFLNSF